MRTCSWVVACITAPQFSMAPPHSATNGGPISEVPHAASVDLSGSCLPGAAAGRRLRGARQLRVPGPLTPEPGRHAHHADAGPAALVYKERCTHHADR